jgi:hypothetical protein
MKQNIILTICITYFFERDNIFKLLNSLKSIKEKEKIEILIRNDNPKIKLKKKNFKNFSNLKIFNTNKKSIGEFLSLRFLTKKSSGKFICFLADDDLISYKFFNIFMTRRKMNYNFLCHATPYRELWGTKNNYRFSNKTKLLNDFFERKIYLNPCVGMIFQKSLLNFENIKILKNYNFDTYLLIYLVKNFNFKLINYNYGYNNVIDSRISSKALSPKIYYNGLSFIIDILDKNLILVFYKFFMENFYSNTFRSNKKILQNVIFATKFHILVKKKISGGTFLNFYLFKYYIKVFLKLVVSRKIYK